MLNLSVSGHILPTSANLLGVCFLIFTALKTLGKSQYTVLDEVAMLGIYVFLVSAVLSYLSLRSEKRNMKLEKAADIVFMGGLFLLVGVSTFLFVTP